MKKVVIWLDEEENKLGIERLRGELDREGIELVVMLSEEELCKLGKKKKDMLVLVDEEPAFEKLIDEEFFVLPVLNNKNQSASFWGALYVLREFGRDRLCVFGVCVYEVCRASDDYFGDGKMYYSGNYDGRCGCSL